MERGSTGANGLVSISVSEEGATHLEANRATEVSIKGGDLVGTCRICVTNWKEWKMKIVLNIIANDNNSSASEVDA